MDKRRPLCAPRGFAAPGYRARASRPGQPNNNNGPLSPKRAPAEPRTRRRFPVHHIRGSLCSPTPRPPDFRACARTNSGRPFNAYQPPPPPADGAGFRLWVRPACSIALVTNAPFIALPRSAAGISAIFQVIFARYETPSAARLRAGSISLLLRETLVIAAALRLFSRRCESDYLFRWS